MVPAIPMLAMKTQLENLRTTIERCAARPDDRRPHPRPHRRAVRGGDGGAGQSRRAGSADDADGMAPHSVRRRAPTAAATCTRTCSSTTTGGPRSSRCPTASSPRRAAAPRSTTVASPCRATPSPPCRPQARRLRPLFEVRAIAVDGSAAEHPTGGEPSGRPGPRQRIAEVGVDPLPLRRFPNRHAASEGVVRDAHARRTRPPASTTTGASRRSAPSTSRAAWSSAGTRCPTRAPTTSTATRSSSIAIAPPTIAPRPPMPTSYFPSFIGINLMFNDDLDCCAWGGSTFLALDGQVAYVPHHLAAALGLREPGPHRARDGTRLRAPALVGAVWPDLRLALGRDERRVGQLPSTGLAGSDLRLRRHSHDLLPQGPPGWIPSNRRYVAAPGTSQTITLEPLDQLASSGYMIARIPLPGSSTRFYTVETRRVLARLRRAAPRACRDHPPGRHDARRSGRAGRRSRRQRRPRRCGRHVAARGGLRRFGERDQRRRPQRDGAGLRRDGEQWRSAPASYTLSVTVTGPGTVTSNPAGIACSAGTCSANFPSGTGVTLTTSGGTLTGWGGACSGTGACSVTMTGNRVASATFSASPTSP